MQEQLNKDANNVGLKINESKTELISRTEEDKINRDNVAYY